MIPRFWRIPKKTKKWAVSPRPGPHKKFESIPLQVIVRDILSIAETGKEAKTIIKKGEILVDGKPRKDSAYPVGLFDVISIPTSNQFYRIVPSASGFTVISISSDEASVKICKVVNKTLVKKNKLQLNLNDGKNILVDDGKYSTGDSILIEVPSLKINGHLKLSKGSLGIILKGKNSGKSAEVKEILLGKFRQPSRIICEIEGKDAEVLKDNFIVVGKEKPLVAVS